MMHEPSARTALAALRRAFRPDMRHGSPRGFAMASRRQAPLRIVLLAALALTALTSPASTNDRHASAGTKVKSALAKKVTLTFKGIEVQEACKILSEQADLNMAIGAGVKGNVTVFLTDVTVGTALDIVTEMTGNAYIIERDIIRIVPEELYIREFGGDFRARRVMESYSIRHIPMREVTTAVAQMQVLTARGAVLPDPGKNTIVIWDTPEAQSRVRELVALLDKPGEIGRIVVRLNNTGTEALLTTVQPHLTEGIGAAQLLGGGDSLAVEDLPARLPHLEEIIRGLDYAPRQVLMEVKILQVSYSDETTVGINWQGIQDELNASIQSSYGVLPKTSTGRVTSGTVLTIGDLADDDFTVVMEALQTYGNTDIVSLPRIVAQNGQEATIHVGSKEPFITVDTRESQGVITTYEKVTQVDVGVKLKITPTIHPDGFISMQVNPEVSSVSRFETTSTGSSIPVVEQSALQTQVRVKSGVHVILGGLMKKELRESKSGLPVLHRIPLIGYAFGSRTLKEVRTELVIMICPTIVAGDEWIGRSARWDEDAEERGE